MKVIIAGGRDVFDFDAVSEAVKKSHYAISEVVSGGAQGADHPADHHALLRCPPFLAASG